MGGIWLGYEIRLLRVMRVGLRGFAMTGVKKKGGGGCDGLLKFGRAWEKRNS